MLKNIKNKLTQYNYLYRESDQKDKNGKQQLQAKAMLPEIGVEIDDTISIIEKENTELKSVLPKIYAKPNLYKTSLRQLRVTL